MELDAALWDEFSRVGWERYDGLALDYPENSYYLIWLGASFFTAFIALVGKLADEDSAIAQWMFFVATISIIGYGLLYLTDGRISIKASMIGWLFTSGFQIVIGIGGIFSPFLSKIVKISLKQLFFLNGILYVVALGLGFYFLNLDNSILVEQNRLGELYEGLSTRFCENTYHFILAALTIGSLFLGTTIKDGEFFYPIYKWVLIFFFLYNVFVVINNGNPDMEETQSWWVTLTISTSVLSFLISKTLENKLPEREEEKPFYKDNILDDLSNLE
jgi:hypothetical protein